MDGQQATHEARQASRPVARLRATTVLFAAVRPKGAPPLHTATTAQCLAVLGQAVDVSGGRVLRSANGELLALFKSPDAAALAAARMQTYAGTIASPSNKLPVRVAFEHGAIAQRNDDIFGDTVNIALRLLDEAQSDQVLTTDDTASQLTPLLQGLARPVTGAGDRPRVEIAWNEHKKLFGTPTGALELAGAGWVLRLTYRGKLVVRRRRDDVITIGRDPECCLGVAARTASRRHCTIERTPSGFLLTDHSTNGTFVTIERAAEQRILNDTLLLSKRGCIAFGEPSCRSEHVVQYDCAEA